MPAPGCARTADAILVCGPTSFVEGVATALVELGHDPSWIRLERFGGSVDSS
jgi:ferredoxin-NADP reductase